MFRFLQMIQKESGTDWKEMYQVFNMGHRMEFYTDEATAKSIIDIASEFDIQAQIVGRVEEGSGATLTIESEVGKFDYEHK